MSAGSGTPAAAGLRDAVAIIGMSGRFPGARDVEQFWDNLLHGRESITRLDPGALRAEGVPAALLDHPGYVPAAPVLEDIDQFDAAFFGISPREAKSLAPAMRLFLECCWEAFEAAACVPGAARTGVFAGANMSQYWRLGSAALEPTLEEILGNDKDYLATYVAYRLNLKGPAVSVQTACSTSLVAVHMAAEALLAGQCDMALAGGAAVRVPHAIGYARAEGSILSPDGHCRPFDAAESGPVFGSGVGVVLLKRLEDALAAGDPIRAVIRGSAVNNDGAGKAGFTAPSVEGQAAVIAEAQARAGVAPRSIGYVEAHGTATRLGDPVEIAALTRAFRLGTADRGFCAIGSVKGNVGHLETAAGVTGLIKAALALDHRVLPASLHFARPNPEIDFASGPFVVNAARRAWESPEGTPRRAGVSSFGMGGTNAHAVLEEAPAPVPPAPDAAEERPHLLLLSARTPTALARMTRGLAAHLRRQDAPRIADVALTLAEGRARFAVRRAVVLGRAEELDAPRAAPPGRAGEARLGLLAGTGMPGAAAHALNAGEPAFRSAVAECVAAGGESWRAVDEWFAAPLPAEWHSSRLAFAAAYAAAMLLRAWGARPEAIGAASAEAVPLAAVLAGVLSLSDGIALLGLPAPEAARRATAAARPALLALDGGEPGLRIAAGAGADEATWQRLFAPRGATGPDAALTWVSLHPSADLLSAQPVTLPAGAFAARRAMLGLFGRLWAAGAAEPDMRAMIAPATARRIPMPGYAFERQRFWIEERRQDEAETAPAPAVERAAVPSAPAVAAAPSDAGAIAAALREILGAALHMPAAQVDPRREFIEMGADSLVLMEAAQAIQRRWGVRLSVREIFESVTTVHALAEHIARAATVAAPAPVQPASTLPAPTPALPPAPRPAGPAAADPMPLDDRQRRHVEALIASYTARTAGSKRLAAEKRPILADVRSSAGFKRFVKEMLYPIVVERGEAGHVIDVDGNDYVDVTMGFGVRLFGHRAPFLTAALEAQLERDAPLGPENRDSGAVARLIRGMTGVERIGIFSTGTEAVMTALRLVRARAGRDRIALFKGSYHGHADLVLGIGLANGQVAPLSAGVPADTLRHLAILDYGTEEALRAIEAEAHSLAAVIVEPVQSRYPDRQPAAFLRALRALTEKHGIALVFDEMITGFRIGAGGAQAWFGVQADVVAYGKVVGGGMPVGVVAGKAAWLDYLDGGTWQYGDESQPTSPTIFYAGTFNKNPWTMAAARATLEEIRRLGPALFTALNRRTAWLATTLNAFFAEHRLPIEVVHFASLFRFVLRGTADLFFFHMVMRGIYVWEGRNCFLCHAHTEDDLRRIAEAAQESALALRDAGLLDPLPGPARTRVPLTEAQRQLLLADAMAEDGLPAYTIHLAVGIEGGAVDTDALELALDGLVRRHEALRTVFPAGAEAAEILPHGWVPLAVEGPLPQQGAEAALEAWFDAGAAARRFDLSRGPLLRAVLLRFGVGGQVLVLSLPHVIADGITLNILLADLVALYGSARAGRLAEMPPATPFSQYVGWLEAALAGPAFRAHEAYWRAQLAGPLPGLSLPLDAPRPAVMRHAAAVERMTLPPSLADGLRRAGQAQGATLFMTCLAAWLALLHRLSGEDDILIGVPTTGRAMEGSATLAGYCTHLLPIRNRLDGAPGFAAFLRQLRATLLDAFEHQDYPFAQLLRLLDLPRDPGRPPLVTATFNMDQPPPLPAMDGLALRMVPPPVRHAGFELALNITDQGDGALVVECRYHTALFGAPRIRAMLAQFRAVLEQAAADPARGLHDVDLARAAPAGLLPDPAAPLPAPEHAPVAAQVLRQAEAAPERIAVEDPRRRWTYGALAEEARRFAGVLLGHGIRPGDRIGIEGECDGRLVAAMLGTWLAGGVFVTLDGALPERRRRAMLDACGARLLVSLGGARTPAGALPALVLAADAPLPEAPLPLILPPVAAESPACVFFTSGTSGAPKGILGRHAGVAQFLAWQRERFGIGAEDRVAQLTGLSFDAVLREIFLPLVCGASLQVPPEEMRAAPVPLLRWIRERAATVLHAVPSRAATLLAAAEAEGATLPALRHLFLSGEPLTRGLAERLRARLAPAARVVNFYGSTETTMIKAYRAVEPGPDAPPPAAVLPMADTQLLVLRGDRLCGIGEAGEIVVRTPFRTAGTLEGGEAAIFAASPFLPGDRLYRSGDLGRYRPDGSVEVLGRLDDQMKIRGVRVEPAEVKAALDAQPGVAGSVVLPREGAGGGMELVAWVVPAAAEAEGLADRLRGALAAALPAAAVPAVILCIPALPLLPSGKVDRAALPAPPAKLRRLAVAPRTPTEAALQEAWAAVLPPAPPGAGEMGVTDNVFELGANSLHATQVASRIRQALGLELPLPLLFEHPTVEALAAHLDLLDQAAGLAAMDGAADDDAALVETL